MKKLALSPPLSPEDYGLIAESSQELTRRHRVKSFLEKSLLVSGLQSAEFTEGKWSVLYFADDKVLQAYLELKEKRRILEESGRLYPAAERQISVDFMRLLSYPDSVIEARLSGSGPAAPFMLID